MAVVQGERDTSMEMLALWGAVFTLLAAVLTVVVIALQFYKEYRDHRGSKHN